MKVLEQREGECEHDSRERERERDLERELERERKREREREREREKERTIAEHNRQSQAMPEERFEREDQQKGNSSVQIDYKRPKEKRSE